MVEQKTTKTASKAVKSHSWFVRITGTLSFLETKLKQFSECIDIENILGFAHQGNNQENPHIHFTVKLRGLVQKQSFDIRIKKLFEITLGTMYSTKPWDGADECNSYMFHEETQPIINIGYSIEELLRLKTICDAHLRIVKMNKEKASYKAPEYVLTLIDENTSKNKICCIFLDLFREGKYHYPGKFQLLKWIDQLYIQTRSDDDWITERNQIACDLLRF